MQKLLSALFFSFIFEVWQKFLRQKLSSTKMLKCYEIVRICQARFLSNNHNHRPFLTPQQSAISDRPLSTTTCDAWTRFLMSRKHGTNDPSCNVSSSGKRAPWPPKPRSTNRQARPLQRIRLNNREHHRLWTNRLLYRVHLIARPDWIASIVHQVRIIVLCWEISCFYLIFV